MTYITAHIPKLEELKKQLEERPNLVEYYLKYEGWDGDSDSIDYLDQKVKEYIKDKKQ